MTLYLLGHLPAFSLANALMFGLLNFLLIFYAAKPASHPLLQHDYLINITFFQ